MPTCNHERAVKYTLICLLYQTEGLHGNCGTYCRQNICVSGEIISTCKLNMHAQVICQFTQQIMLIFYNCCAQPMDQTAKICSRIMVYIVHRRMQYVYT